MRVRDKNDAIVSLQHIQTWLEGFSRGAGDDEGFLMACQLKRVADWLEKTVKD